MTERGPYRDGKIHVHADRCASCIFRPGNTLRLQPGRVQGLVAEARANNSTITCHETYDVMQAICAGFASLTPQPDILQLAERMEMITEVEPPTEWHGFRLDTSDS